MTDKGRNHEDESPEDDEDAIEAHALDLLRDGARDSMQESGTRDGFAEGEAAGGEDDDGPEEVVEVFFGENTSAEEKDDGYDGHDAHVPKDVFELVGDAPQHDGYDRHAADEPLHTGELVLHGPNGNDRGAFTGLKCDEQ